MDMNTSEQSYIVLVDGKCVLCDTFAQFIISRDDNSKFYFGTQQEAFGQNLLASHGILNDLKTIILISKFNNHISIHTKSEAILRILKELNFPWSLSSFFLYVPTFLRDFIYEQVIRFLIYF